MNRDKERKRIGRRISDIRKTIEWTDNSGIRRKGMTQIDLSELCGLSQSHIARIENGIYNIQIDTLAMIAEAFGMKVDLVKT